MSMSVDISEILSRFVLQKNWYRPSDNTVKHAAFMPNPHNGKTSVFRISGISNKEVWDIGEREVAVKLDKTILGRADIITHNVMSNNLQVIPDEPPPRHANIVGWPEEKSKQLQIAIDLAVEAKFYAKSSSDF